MTAFAYTFPYSYGDMLKLGESLSTLAAKRLAHIYFHREVLAHSPEGRRVELWTITSHPRGQLHR